MKPTGTRAMTGARKQGAGLDFYPTPPSATQALLNRESFPFDGVYLEPAAGRGDMLDVLRKDLGNVFGSDIQDYGHKDITHGVDFLSSKFGDRPYDAVITNPPYSLAEAFVHRALDIVDPETGRVCMFLRMAFLEGQRRRKTLFEITPLARIWAFSARQSLWRNGVQEEGASSGAIFFAWFVWDKAHPVGGPVTIGFADDIA